MKYIIKNAVGYYKFCRKIPSTNQQFVFSTKSKNIKTAKKIVNAFLVKSNPYFLHLQTLSHKEVMTKLSEIQKVLKEYKTAALEEYSPLESERQSHFSHEQADGAHPEAIQYWTKELQNYVCNRKTERQTKELVKQILKRSTLSLKHYYQSLDNPEDQKLFMTLLIKTEVKILREDYKRAKEYFDLDYQLEQESNNNQVQRLENIIANKVEQAMTSPVSATELSKEMSFQEKQLYRQKTKWEVYEEYIEDLKKKPSYIADTIESPIKTLLQSSEEEYLIDFELKDYDTFFEALLYTPASITKKKKTFSAYDYNFVAISADFQNDNIDPDLITGKELEIQSVKTLSQKLGKVKKFVQTCRKNKYIDHDYLEDNERFSARHFDNVAKAEQEREPFNQVELKTMFSLLIERNCYIDKIEKFYLPIIALFSGMRVEEIAKLTVNDIHFEDNIYYINVIGKVKSKSSVRKVPIHSHLIKRFKLLDYIEYREENGFEMLFDLTPIHLQKKTKYSHYYIREFTEFRNEFVSINRINYDRVSFHSFRHTFTTRLGESDVEETVISRIVGHKISKASETPRYNKTSMSKMERAVKKMYLKDIEISLKELEQAFKKVVEF